MEEQFDVLNQFYQWTGEAATRSECHTNGLYHRGVVVFILNHTGNKVLLQKRSADKKLWPNLWDVSAGGHVLTGEIGYEAALRELREELGITAEPHDLLLIGCNTSQNIFPGINDFHINEYYVLFRDLDPVTLELQTEEVSDVAWVSSDELQQRLDHDKDGLVKKDDCFETLLRFLSHHEAKNNL